MIAAWFCFSAHPFLHVQVSAVIGNLRGSCTSRIEALRGQHARVRPLETLAIHGAAQAAGAAPACLRHTQLRRQPWTNHGCAVDELRRSRKSALRNFELSLRRHAGNGALSPVSAFFRCTWRCLRS